MSTKLNESQKIVCNLLATGMKTSDILQQIKIRPETLSRWKQNQLFKECLELAQEKIIKNIQETQKYILLKSQHCVVQALENDDLDIVKKAMIALRYLALTKGKETIEDKINRISKDVDFDKKFGFKL
tara:strand:+ start:140 stop:523 length:384 start_codon:yes stop_codon:yes gene_type:complete